MGVPALFRWLSKKYPKIITPVIEEEEVKVSDEQGNDISIPIDISAPNPNNYEFDNLYLDMNAIVHPCTHPEGKAAPETEEEMMVEVFKYTEKVVNMIRPRKVLFMAIDGVAPRAKMNQQRSRRFRAAQEAQDKVDARKEAIAMWKAMGKELSDNEENKEAWDTNAITPGTPFMDLLASSLRYWVARKLNSDPGWKTMQVYLSDASVPGEGEHKIMDFIRRQRSNPGHDPNTRHVIYGLDADLIMLALATHEPHFRVLREDVFFQDTSPGMCRICGQEGHYAAQCTGTKTEVKKEPPKQKPFIFLDVSILREYLEVELNVTQALFPFNLEQAIDDWILLIFFVGNDFLPHLPSLEIREGAIDTLLKIWKDELPRMGGYVTNHGQLELSRAEIILTGLARREDEIFRRRREAEERQDQNAKRRKIEMQSGDVNDRHPHGSSEVGPSSSLQLTANPQAPQSFQSAHPSLPARPDFAARADSIGLGGPRTADAVQNTSAATQALAGSNRDVVANRRAIRMANMSAAEMLKAELGGLQPVKQSASSPVKSERPVASTDVAPPAPFIDGIQPVVEDDLDVPGFGNASAMDLVPAASFEASLSEGNGSEVNDSTGPYVPSQGDIDTGNNKNEDEALKFLQGVKRKLEETEDAEEPQDVLEDEEAGKNALALKVNADGTVEQEDTVRLWEPGYRERYYQQKFDVDYNDEEFKRSVTTSYVEGLAWVLHYYYQGTPSWQWFYPYHFAPFAADFVDVDQMQLNFVLGQPSKPFEQLMSVFPAASRKHIPPVFHDLMTNQDSPIIDFYPTSFEIDMNGKKMAWQGVALLPFIDEKRLLEAMSRFYPNLTESELHRNKWGNNVLFVSDDNPLYPSLEALYGKRKNQEPVPMDPRPSKGINGSLLPNPDCIPGSTFYSPLRDQNLADIPNDRSLSGLYFFPKQLSPHRSIMLPGVRKAPRTLTAGDLEVTRRGGRGRGYGDRGGGRGGGSRGGGGYNDRGGYSNGRDIGYNGSRDSYRGPPVGNSPYQQYSSNNSYQRPSPSPYPQHGYKQPPSYPPQDQRQSYQQPQSYGSYGGGPSSPYGGGGSGNGNYYGSSPRGGPPPPRGRGQGAYGSGGYPNNRGGYGGDSSAGYGYQASYGGLPPLVNSGYPSGRGGYGGGGYNGGGGYPSSAPPTYSTGFESYGNGRSNGGYRGRGRGGRY